MKKRLTSTILTLLSAASFAQVTIKGIIVEKGIKTPLTSAIAHELGTTNAAVSDFDGKYELSIPEGKVKVIYSYTGYVSDTVEYNFSSNIYNVSPIYLSSADKELNTVVIGTSKTGRKIQQESVSIEVFKPQVIENNNITNVRDVLSKVPGVSVLDNSVSIRGGSGYSYGSGSRVQMVVDEIPLITPDRGEIQWALVPLENVEQVEVMKGASSVQYGSAALNGVINVRSKDMTNDKDTFAVSASTFLELFDKPPVASYNWWKGSSLSFLEKPHTAGFTFNYRQKIKDFQWQIGANVQEQKSYLQSEFDNRGRVSAKIRYTPHQLKKRLYVGLSTMFLWHKDAFQFYWQDLADAYKPASGVTLNDNYFYAVIDPTIGYHDDKGNSYRLYNRYYYEKSLTGSASTVNFSQIYNDFQYRHQFGELFQLLVGATNTHYTVSDHNLGGHQGNIGGGYLQGELHWNGLTITLGGRLEYWNLDKTTQMAQPVGRFGINYQFKKYNYLHFGIGQGYRFGSLAERFVNTSLGSSIFILPNPQLKPESGMTVELGYKRSFSIGSKWRGYADATLFYNQYQNMIQFTLDSIAINNGTIQSFFQSLNITQARIMGWEFSLVGEGSIGKYVQLNFQGGYTYFYGEDLSSQYANPSAKYFLEQTFKNFIHTDSASRLAMLKYRQPKQFKFDVDVLLFGHARIGSSVMYYSYMDNIDGFFNIAISGLQQSRQQTLGQGDWIWNLRAGYQINPHISIGFLVNNVLNHDYSLRPAHPNAPRSFTTQLSVKF